jgi:hypothetical protein
MKTDRGKWITLTKVEVEIGVRIGVMRHLNALREGAKDAYGFKGDPWELHIQGACAEMASYKAIGRYWSPTIDVRKEAGGDGGPYEVRRRSQQHYDHLIKERDLVDAPHILACGLLPTFRVVGWIYGYEARRDDWWHNKHGGRGWAWWPPQEELHDLDELPVL